MWRIVRSPRSRQSPSAAKSASLILRAPREPPNTHSSLRAGSTSSLWHAASRPADRSTLLTAERTGLPVHTALGRSTSGNGTAAALANLEPNRLATLGTAFCSATTNGTRQTIAATTPGTEAKPPTPTTTAGRHLAIRTMASTMAAQSPATAPTLRNVSWRAIPRPGRAVKVNPASGTILVSSPRRLPT